MSDRLRINLIARDNGLGLSRDLRLLADALEANACDVHVTRLDENDERRRWALGRRGWRAALRRLRVRLRKIETRFDVNIMLEHLWPEHLPLAKCNVALPNPEWFDEKDRLHLRRIDRVWVKTKHAEKLFNQLGCAVTWVGFASEDCYEAGIVRRKAFFHLAGGSRTKGTAQLVALWRQHPEWPTLTLASHANSALAGPGVGNIELLTHYLTLEQLRDIQNSHQFHLCPSETEGYGHYLCEAMSVAAVTITTNAAPMNELLDEHRGVLVSAEPNGQLGLSTLYRFDAKAMEHAVIRAIRMDAAEIHGIGAHARAWFVENQARFSGRIGAALKSLIV
jgi:hypothetical protein